MRTSLTRRRLGDVLVVLLMSGVACRETSALAPPPPNPDVGKARGMVRSG